MIRHNLRLPTLMNLVVGGTVMVAMSDSASAITVEVARKCEALTMKAFPPKVIGNPAAGLANGTPMQRQNYFSKCVANNGTVDNESEKPTK